MQIFIHAIGKLKPGPERALFDHYAQRLSWKLAAKEYDLKKSVDASLRKEQEGGLLLAGCADAEHVIALDEKGTELTSAQFAQALAKLRDSGVRTIAFLIGGADGLSADCLKRAHRTLCFGRLTWPHMLVRGLLAEQLYRAQTILSGHPYHRE